MIRRHLTALHVALMAVDVFAAVVLFLFIAEFRFGGAEWRRVVNVTALGPWSAALIYALAWVGILYFRGLYRLRARWSIRREALDIFGAVVVLAFVTFAVLFLLKLTDISRLFLFILFPSQAALTLVSRLVLRMAFSALRERGANTQFALVVGAGPDAQTFADEVEARRELGLRVIGHLAEPAVAGSPPPSVTRPVLGTVDDIERVLHSEVVDEVAICLPREAWSLVEPVARLCEDEGKVVRIPLEAFGLPLEGGIVEEFEGRQILSVVYGPDRALGLLLKRVVDVALASAALIVLSPVFLTVALWIRLAAGAPILFRQARVGLHGRPFTLLKFRTMVPDAEARLRDIEQLNEVRGRAFKVTDDPRLTGPGRFLRRTSLDELPQFLNVLKGEMSLVGPRPPLPSEVGTYDVWHRRRLSMKPGITGLWQVEGRAEPEFDRWVEMDLDYIDRWSLWLDFQIILRTIPAVIGGTGR